MGVSVWSGCGGGGGVSIRLLTVKLPHSEPALPTAGSVRSGGSILKGCVNTSEGWVGEGMWGVSPHPQLLSADTHWTLTNIHTCTRTKRSLCTQHQPVFFDVRVTFKMSLGS